MRSATASAHPNIALAKYWGKCPGSANVPAVPSLSVTLSGMSTTTTVSFDDTLLHDELVINDARMGGRSLARASALLDVVRAEANMTARSARIVSKNDFPTASGLASSASGFAALALAAVRAAGLDWSLSQVSDLARRSSASAARSLFGGFVELDGGEGGEGGVACARPIASPDSIDLRVLVCVTAEGAKSISSTCGMRMTQETSPYYDAWLVHARRLFVQIRSDLLAGDFHAVGEGAEKSALGMHACAMAAGIVYVTGATLAALAEVRAMRAEGIDAYATIDAGPHLKCLTTSRSMHDAKERLLRVPGVLRIVETLPGEGACITQESLGQESPAQGKPGR
ncbi:MAG: diphosphomevalonate decarboxylase [Polyangiaceae bacterium]|nr:diphosphomevalonate decarboxylase [Polyangiaceae bacterium]